MRDTILSIGIMFLGLLLPRVACAQQQATPAAPLQAKQAPGFAMGAPAGPSSPEVLSAKRVIFRLNAPQACMRWIINRADCGSTPEGKH
jgi:hypothetical protein